MHRMPNFRDFVTNFSDKTRINGEIWVNVASAAMFPELSGFCLGKFRIIGVYKRVVAKKG
jgi:hypothetical protein